MTDTAQTKIIALRGASKTAPPNTLPAILKGVDQGADGTFLDVRFSRDGIPIIAGETKLEKISNGNGRVVKTKFEDIQKLDAGSWFSSEFAGTPIPSLEDVLAKLPVTHIVILHLHDTDMKIEHGEQLKSLAEKWISGGGTITLLVNDSMTVGKILRWNVDKLNVLLMLSDKVDGWLVMQKAEKLGLKGIMPHRKQIDTVLVREASKNGLSVTAFFANAEEDMQELIDMGVDNIITCWPDKLKKLLNEARS